MLKKMTAACICFMVCAGTVSAQERYTVDKVVAVVGNSAIKYSELVEARNVLVEERRKQIGKQNGQHHPFRISRVDHTNQDTHRTNEHAIAPFTSMRSVPRWRHVWR